MRYITEIRCAVSMVTERLLVNIRLRLWATWPFKYEDGWRVCVGGELFTISRKTRIEILRVASTLKYTNSSFQHFHCLFESETINPVNTHQTISVQSFHSLISAVQNRFKLLQCHLSISLLRGGVEERLYPPTLHIRWLLCDGGWKATLCQDHTRLALVNVQNAVNSKELSIIAKKCYHNILCQSIKQITHCNLQITYIITIMRSYLPISIYTH